VGRRHDVSPSMGGEHLTSGLSLRLSMPLCFSHPLHGLLGSLLGQREGEAWPRKWADVVESKCPRGVRAYLLPLQEQTLYFWSRECLPHCALEITIRRCPRLNDWAALTEFDDYIVSGVEKSLYFIPKSLSCETPHTPSGHGLVHDDLPYVVSAFTRPSACQYSRINRIVILGTAEKLKDQPCNNQPSRGSL